MFPLKERNIIRGCNEHIAAGLGCAEDDVAEINTPVYAPFDGELSIPYPRYRNGKETGGGNWLRLTRDSGDMIEMAHLRSYIKRSGRVQEGEKIAYTGNTGSTTTGPHFHIQIITKNGDRIDPATYNWQSTMEKKKQLAQRVDQLKQQVRRLHREVRRVTKEALNWKRKYEAELSGRMQDIKEKQQNYRKWQKEIDKKNRWKRKFEACRDKQLSGLSVAEKVREALRIMGL